MIDVTDTALDPPLVPPAVPEDQVEMMVQYSALPDKERKYYRRRLYQAQSK